MAAPDLGTGSTITWQSSFFANILNLSWSGISRESIKTSHMGTTTADTFIPADRFDPGELSVEIEFAAGTRPPIDQVAQTCTIDFGGAGTNNKWAASAFMTGFEITAADEEMMTATGTLKFSGDITLT